MNEGELHHEMARRIERGNIRALDKLREEAVGSFFQRVETEVRSFLETSARRLHSHHALLAKTRWSDYDVKTVHPLPTRSSIYA